VAVGLLMIRMPLGSKLGVLALLVALVVLSGVFLPIFSKQVLDGVFASAVFLVFVAWLAYHVMIAPPQWKLTVARQPVTEPVAAEPVKTSAESPFAAAEVSSSGESPPPAAEAPPANQEEGGRHEG
jgi:hypothetical protein